MLSPVELVAVVFAALLIATAAWQDFIRWKIRNWIVVTLIGVYFCLAMLRVLVPAVSVGGWGELIGDVGAGFLLLAIGSTLWLFRLFGAGDAKFLFPVGLFVGVHHLFAFGMGLAVGGVLAAVLLRFPMPLRFQVWPVAFRIEEIRRTGKVPYGVVVAGAALVAMYLRYFPS